MPHRFSRLKTPTTLGRELEKLALQGQGHYFAIKDVLDTDPQSPFSHRKMRSELSGLHKVLILMQTAALWVERLPNDPPELNHTDHARLDCRPTRSLNEPR